MKKQSPGYYRPPVSELKARFEQCVFCLDTNTLLHLYRYSKDSVEQLLAFLTSVKTRIWLPHQVALEYQRRRIDVLSERHSINGKVAAICADAIVACNQIRRSELFASASIVDPVINKLQQISEKLKADSSAMPDPMSGDEIFVAVTDMFAGKVGPSYTEDELKAKYSEAKQRYEQKVPPGYEDASKTPNDVGQYGDYLIWQQLLDFAKSEERPIIFVTDDLKEDWWREHSGRKLGPRPELIQEFSRIVGAEKWFYMYTTQQFLEHANEYLNAKVNASVIEEAKGIAERSEDNSKHQRPTPRHAKRMVEVQLFLQTIAENIESGDFDPEKLEWWKSVLIAAKAWLKQVKHVRAARRIEWLQTALDELLVVVVRHSHDSSTPLDESRDFLFRVKRAIAYARKADKYIATILAPMSAMISADPPYSA